MPTYQYACTECAHAFEQFQSFTEDALTECPQCRGRLRKVFNAVGVVFKGSGFYRTDSRGTPEPATSSPSSDANGSAKPAPADSGNATAKKDRQPATAAAGTTSAD